MTATEDDLQRTGLYAMPAWMEPRETKAETRKVSRAKRAVDRAKAAWERARDSSESDAEKRMKREAYERARSVLHWVVESVREQQLRRE